jgi:GntR family transcriptional regulator
MLLRIRPDDPAPLFEQIAAQIRRNIQEGSVAVGQRLPSARELAASLDVNLHTVLRAYDLLRNDGVVEMRPGRGVTVVAQAQERTKLLDLARALLDESRRQGLRLNELKRLLEEL